MKRLRRMLFPALLLLAFVGLATPRAHADDWTTTATISDYLHNYADADFPTYTEFIDLHDLFNCLSTISSLDDVPFCFAALKSTNNAWIDSIQRLSMFYVDVDTGNYNDLVVQFGFWFEVDAPCIVADILTGGGTSLLCEGVMELANLILDNSHYIWDVLQEVAHIAGEIVSDVECWVSDCDSETPLEIAYNLYFREVQECINPDTGAADNVKCGLLWRENPDPKYFESALNDQVNAAQQVNANPVNMTVPKVQPSDIVTASNVFRGAVNMQWDDAILNPSYGTWYPMQNIRGQWMGEQMTQYIFNLAAQDHVSNPARYPYLSGAIWDECSSQWPLHNAQYNYIDHWFDVPTSDQAQLAKMKFRNTHQWCINDFNQSRPEKFLPLYVQFIGSTFHCGIPGGMMITGQDFDLTCPTEQAKDQCTKVMADLQGLHEKVRCVNTPACPVYMETYYCPSLAEYKACEAWAAANPRPGNIAPCAFDTSVDGPAAARSVLNDLKNGNLDPINNLHSAPSQYAAQCSIDGHPVEFDAGGAIKAPVAGKISQAVVGAQGQSGRASVAGSISQAVTGAQGQNAKQPVQAQTATATTAHTYSNELQKAPPTGPSVLDCPRPTLKHFCEINYQHRVPSQGMPTALVSCTASHLEPAYQQMASKVDVFAQSTANLHRTYDPLVLVAPPVYGTHCPQGFHCVTQLSPTADGVNEPTLVLLGGGATLSPQAQHTAIAPEMTAPASNQTQPVPAHSLQVPNILPKVQLPGKMSIPLPSKGSIPIPGKSNSTVPASVSSSVTQSAGSDTALADFNKWSSLWQGRVMVQPPTPNCNCADIYSQIGAVDQKGAGLMRSGTELSTMLNSGKLDADGTNKAVLSLNNITQQLNQSLVQRHQLVGQYGAMRNGKH